MDCQRGQQLHQFLARHQLSMAGTTPRMLDDHVFMVSVSATPFAEESVMAHGDSLPKAMVRLRVDASYYGPAEYARDGLLKEMFSVETEEKQALFRREVYEAWSKQKYVLVRLRESAVQGRQLRRTLHREERKNDDDEREEEEKEEPVTKAEAIYELLNRIVSETPGARILHFTSKYINAGQEIVTTEEEADEFFRTYGRTIPSLDVAPSCPTVVLLDGRLRCGKRLMKKHIGLAVDTAVSSSTDVILQGLLGRMCGYLGSGDGNVPLNLEDRTRIYTTETLFRQDSGATVPLSDLERFQAVQSGDGVWGMDAEDMPLVTPRFANHLLRSDIERVMKKRNTGETVYQCAPIQFVLPTEVVEQMDANIKDSDLARVCEEFFLCLLEELVDVNEDMTPLQREEIRSWMERGQECHIRRFHNGSNQNMYRHMVRAYQARMAMSKERVNDGHPVTFCVVLGGAGEEPGMLADPPGTVYVSMYTRAEGYTRIIPLSSRIPYHDKKTHFMVHTPSDGDGIVVPGVVEERVEPIVGMSSYGFTPEIQWSPATLEIQLDFFLRLAKCGIGHFEHVWHGIQGKKGIPLSEEAYGENLALLRIMLQRLEVVHGVRVRYGRAGCRTADTIYLKWIGW
jgi:hypothetical protein